MKVKAILYPKKKVEAWQREIEEKVERWKEARRPAIEQFQTNLALYTGHHYMAFDPNRGELVDAPPLYDDQVRVTFNFVLPKCRTAIAKNTENAPYAQSIPNSNEERDIRAARIAEAITKYDYRSKGLAQKYNFLSMDDVVFGEAWLFTTWYKYSGQTYKKYKQEPAMEEYTPGEGEAWGEDEYGNQVKPKRQKVGEDGNVVMQNAVGADGEPVIEEEIPEGDVKYERVLPSCVLFDSSVSEIEELPDVARREWKSIDYIKRTFPNCSDITGDHDSRDQCDDVYMTLYGHGFQPVGDQKEKGAYVVQYYSKACHEYPEGLYMVIVENKVRVCEPLFGLRGKRLPCSQARYFAIPGCLRGIGLPELLASPQQTYNKLMSQIVENAIRVINIKVLVRGGEKVSALTNEVGQVVEYWGTKPDYWQPAPLPQTHHQTLATVRGAIHSISGISPISEGETDPSINSGEQVAEMRENDQRKHNPQVDDFVSMICDSIHLALTYYAEGVTEERMVRIVGDDKRADVVKFVGADIGENVDVQQRPSSMNFYSRSSERKTILTMLETGVADKLPPDKQSAFLQKAIERLNFSEADKFIGEMNIHSAKARRENDDMDRGIPAYVMPWHDPDVHIYEHENHINSNDFEMLDDDAKQINVAHLEMHYSKRNQQMDESAGPAPGLQMGLPGMEPAGQGGVPPQAEQAGPGPVQGSQMPPSGRNPLAALGMPPMPQGGGTIPPPPGGGQVTTPFRGLGNG